MVARFECFTAIRQHRAHQSEAGVGYDLSVRPTYIGLTYFNKVPAVQSIALVDCDFVSLPTHEKMKN